MTSAAVLHIVLNIPGTWGRDAFLGKLEECGLLFGEDFDFFHLPRNVDNSKFISASIRVISEEAEEKLFSLDGLGIKLPNYRWTHMRVRKDKDQPSFRDIWAVEHRRASSMIWLCEQTAWLEEEMIPPSSVAAAC